MTDIKIVITGGSDLGTGYAKKASANHCSTIGTMFAKFVSVDRSRSPRQVFSVFERGFYDKINWSVVHGMPRGDGKKPKALFFSLRKGPVTAEEVINYYELLNLEPDPYAQAAVNESDRDFARSYPNASVWIDDDGNFCSSAFSPFALDPMTIRVGHLNPDDCVSSADGEMWFAGVPR